MIWLDAPLIFTCIFFFFLSFAYGDGMLRVKMFGKDMKDEFAWDLAATVGIASVVSCTTVFVWLVRQAMGITPLPNIYQVPFDLAMVFLSALPGMTLHRIRLNEYRQKKSDRSNHQLELLQEQTREILKQQKETKLMLAEVLSLIGMRREAMEYLDHLQDYHN